MTDDALLKLASGVHVTILLGAIGHLYVISVSSRFIDAAGKDSRALCERLRRVMAGNLADHLADVFRQPDIVVDTKTVTDAEGRPYLDPVLSPVGSEAYRDAFKFFIDSDDKSLIDYRSILQIRTGLMNCIEKLRRMALALIWISGFFALASLAYRTGLADSVLDYVVWVSISLNIVPIIACLRHWGSIVSLENLLNRLKVEYDG